jgi:hypothetical protein
MSHSRSADFDEVMEGGIIRGRARLAGIARRRPAHARLQHLPLRPLSGRRACRALAADMDRMDKSFETRVWQESRPSRLVVEIGARCCRRCRRARTHLPSLPCSVAGLFGVAGLRQPRSQRPHSRNAPSSSSCRSRPGRCSTCCRACSARSCPRGGGTRLSSRSSGGRHQSRR